MVSNETYGALSYSRCGSVGLIALSSVIPSRTWTLDDVNIIVIPDMCVVIMEFAHYLMITEEHCL